MSQARTVHLPIDCMGFDPDEVMKRVIDGNLFVCIDQGLLGIAGWPTSVRRIKGGLEADVVFLGEHNRAIVSASPQSYCLTLEVIIKRRAPTHEDAPGCAIDFEVKALLLAKRA